MGTNEKYAKLGQRGAKFVDPSISREWLKLLTSNTFIKEYRSSSDLLLVKFM